MFKGGLIRVPTLFVANLAVNTYTLNRECKEILCRVWMIDSSTRTLCLLTVSFEDNIGLGIGEERSPNRNNREL
jgi:hypothetical protein